MIDVVCRIAIARPPGTVAAFMFDAANDPAWIGGVRRVEPARPGPPALGLRVGRAGAFLGKRIAWTTEIVELVPGARLRLALAEGPFRGTVTYEIAPDGAGAAVSIRNAGSAKGLPDFLAAPMVRLGVRGDLKRLKRVLEAA